MAMPDNAPLGAIEASHPPANQRSLSATQRREFEKCKDVICRGLSTFYEVGAALTYIKHGGLYREDHKTFESFCREAFDLSRAHAYRLIESSQVMNNLSPMGDKCHLPKNERQVRALSKLPAAEQRLVWGKVFDLTKKRKCPITKELISAAVEDVFAGNGRTAPSAKNRSRKQSLTDFLDQLEALLVCDKKVEALNLIKSFKEVLFTLAQPIK
jgi:hypothetical protein